MAGNQPISFNNTSATWNVYRYFLFYHLGSRMIQKDCHNWSRNDRLTALESQTMTFISFDVGAKLAVVTKVTIRIWPLLTSGCSSWWPLLRSFTYYHFCYCFSWFLLYSESFKFTGKPFTRPWCIYNETLQTVLMYNENENVHFILIFPYKFWKKSNSFYHECFDFAFYFDLLDYIQILFLYVYI